MKKCIFVSFLKKKTRFHLIVKVLFQGSFQLLLFIAVVSEAYVDGSDVSDESENIVARRLWN